VPQLELLQLEEYTSTLNNLQEEQCGALKLNHVNLPNLKIALATVCMQISIQIAVTTTHTHLKVINQKFIQTTMEDQETTILNIQETNTEIATNQKVLLHSNNQVDFIDLV